jgi:hypothetical protein
MISLVGLGNAASRIVEHFREIPQYNIFSLGSGLEKGKNSFVLKVHNTPEEYEQNIPNLKSFFKNIDEEVQFFIVGSAMSSNYSLGVLEQIKNKKIDLFYIKPDTDLISGIPKLVENAAFGVLQEYARSGLLNSMTVISNLNVEEILQNVPIKKYYETLNESIFSTVHYLNYFLHNEPELGVTTKPSEICKIKSIGVLNMETLEEKWFFDLDMERDLCYYLCINKERLATDGSLHKKYVNILKKKPRNAFRNISYSIYETDLKTDFGFCVAHTNAIQKNA